MLYPWGRAFSFFLAALSFLFCQTDLCFTFTCIHMDIIEVIEHTILCAGTDMIKTNKENKERLEPGCVMNHGPQGDQ